jgi:hypothetical protein
VDSWCLTIQGSGPHGTGAPTDVDAIAKGAVDQLKAAGHQLQSAQLWAGTATLIVLAAETTPDHGVQMSGDPGDIGPPAS